MGLLGRERSGPRSLPFNLRHAMQQPSTFSILVFLILCWAVFGIRFSMLVNSWRQWILVTVGGLLPVAVGVLVSHSKEEPISAFVVAIAGVMLCFAISTIGWGSKMRSVYEVRDAKDPKIRNSTEWPKGFIRVSFVLTLMWIIAFAAVSMNWS